MPPFHVLSFAFRIIVMHPCLVAGDSSFQDTRIFTSSNELGRNLHALSLLHNSKLLANPPCADVSVFQIIMQCGMCGSIADIRMCSHFRHRYPSSLIMASALSMWSSVRDVDGRPTLTCLRPDLNFSTHSNLSLTSALSILSQHTTVNFHRFYPCPKKPPYATFFDGAISQRSVHVFALVAAIRLKAELYCKWLNSSTGIVNTAQCASSSLSRLPRNLKLPLLFYSPS